VGLQPGVNLPGPAAFRRIAGDVEKIRFLMATGTFIRRLSRSDRIPAIAATPIRHIALRADITLKLPFGRIAAQATFHGHFFFWGCHDLHLHPSGLQRKVAILLYIFGLKVSLFLGFETSLPKY
jgi:hypothetical protein